MIPKMPKFATEREEADWWYEQREVIGEEFVKAVKNGLKAGPSSHTRRLAAGRGITSEEMQAELDHRKSPSEPEQTPALPRSA